MIITVGCKSWGTQVGLRLYGRAIRELASIVVHPGRNYAHASLRAFLLAVQYGELPEAYTRNLIVMRLQGDVVPLEVKATFSVLPPKSTQGYITAPRNTWLNEYVKSNLKSDIDVIYQSLPDTDILIIQR